jgi:phage terminase Nu1 subunit (DNA packaging protein)
MEFPPEAYDERQHVDELKDAIKVAHTKLCNKDEQVNKFMHENIELKAKVQVLKELIRELNYG